jgi:hypothetical protein
MHITKLRKVGGSVMMAVPPALLDILHLQPGAKVGFAVENGRLVVNRTRGAGIPWTSCSPNAIRRRRAPGKSRNGSIVGPHAVSLSDELR